MLVPLTTIENASAVIKKTEHIFAAFQLRLFECNDLISQKVYVYACENDALGQTLDNDNCTAVSICCELVHTNSTTVTYCKLVGQLFRQKVVQQALHLNRL